MKNIISFLFFLLLTSCGFVHFMGTKERVNKTDKEISEYLQKIKFNNYDYSIKIKDIYLDSLANKEHVLDLYKLKHGTSKQSHMQMRIYDPEGNLISGYEQCYGDFNRLNILEEKEFKKFDWLPTNYDLKLKNEYDLWDIPLVLKKEISQKANDKKYKIIIYWNIWSNHYSKIMFKKLNKYIHKYDPQRKTIFIVIVNTDADPSTLNKL